MIWMLLRQHGKIIDTQTGSFTHHMWLLFIPHHHDYLYIAPSTQTIVCICARIKPMLYGLWSSIPILEILVWPLQNPMNMDWWPYPKVTNWWYYPFMFQTTKQMSISSSWSWHIIWRFLDSSTRNTRTLGTNHRKASAILVHMIQHWKKVLEADLGHCSYYDSYAFGRTNEL